VNEQESFVMIRPMTTAAENAPAEAAPEPPISGNQLLPYAQQQFKAKNYELARYCFALATRREPGSFHAHYGLAMSAFRLGDLVTAKRAFERSEEIDPLHAGTAAHLGLVHQLGEMDTAISYLRRAIQLDPKRSDNYYNLGLIYRKQGRISLAVQMYEEAYRRNSRLIDAAFNLANIHFESGEWMLARSFYQQVLEQSPTFFRATVGLKRVEGKLKSQAIAGPKATAKFAAAFRG
jgi:tetratricopeptide (TPR) repeat protein